MKCLIVATALCVFAHCTLSNTKVPVLRLADLTNQAHQRAKRELETDSILRRVGCLATAIDYQCSSGYGQQGVNIALGCGLSDVAMNIAGSCQRIENGDFCVPATLRYIGKDAETFNRARSRLLPQC